MTDAFLTRYCDFFESLDQQRLDDIDKLFHPDALFRDPFNHVRGREAIRRIFEHLLREHPRTRFQVIEAVPSMLTAYIRWTFRPDADKALQIEGVSRVMFDANGAVIEHRDYWDSASELFAQLPLTGPPTRWLLRKAQADPEDQVE